MARLVALALSVALSGLVGCDMLEIERRSFQDCVLENVGSASDTSVAEMLREACARKFQVEMPKLAISQLNGTAGYEFASFVIRINNRNSEWIVTELQYYFAVGDRRDSFLESLNIEPLNNGAFSPSVDERPKRGDDFSWGI